MPLAMNDEDVYADDFLGGAEPVNHRDLWLKKVKFWWFRNVKQGPVGGLGIPMYDMDDPHNEAPEEIVLREEPYRKSRISGVALKITIFVCVVISFAVFLLVQVMKSAGEHVVAGVSYNANIRYNNGTHEFNPVNIVIKIDGLNPGAIDATNMPFLNKLYNGEPGSSKLLEGIPYRTLKGGLEPVFPRLNDANVWSMMSGLNPPDHGVVYDGDDSKVMPLWLQLEKSFHGYKVGMDSNWIQDGSRYKPTYYNNDHKDIVEWMLSLIDVESIDERPQLLLSTLKGYETYLENGYDGHELYKLDRTITELVMELRRRHLESFCNIVIVSDYGLSIAAPDHLLYVSNIIESELIESQRIDNGMLSLFVSNGHKNEIYNKLLHHNATLSIVLKQQLSEGYSSLKQLGDILVTPRACYALSPTKFNSIDNGLFIGMGPFFNTTEIKDKTTVIPHVTVYELLCDMLGLSHKDRTPDRMPITMKHTLTTTTTTALTCDVVTTSTTTNTIPSHDLIADGAQLLDDIVQWLDGLTSEFQH